MTTVSRHAGFTTSRENPDKHIEALHAAIEALEPYSLIPNANRRPNGDWRFLVSHHDRALATPAQRKKKVFTQATIRIQHRAFEKLQQHYRWGTKQ